MKTEQDNNPNDFAYIKNQLDFDTLSELKSVFQKKVGKSAAEAIMVYCDNICSFADHESYSSAVNERDKNQ